jgi:hypothetical protein
LPILARLLAIGFLASAKGWISKNYPYDSGRQGPYYVTTSIEPEIHLSLLFPLSRKIFFLHSPE